jgi:hypothetical protein
MWTAGRILDFAVMRLGSDRFEAEVIDGTERSGWPEQVVDEKLPIRGSDYPNVSAA